MPSAVAVEILAVEPEASDEDWRMVEELAAADGEPIQDRVDILGARASEQLAAMEDAVADLMAGLSGLGTRSKTQTTAKESKQSSQPLDADGVQPEETKNGRDATTRDAR